MTGYKSKFFRWDCRDKGCYYESLPDWGDLIECFPRGIRPTDIDGMVELNRHFLFLEQKSAGKSLDNGQRIALQRLCAMPGVSAVIFRPGFGSDVECLVYSADTALLPGWEPCDGFRPHAREEFRTWLRAWVAHAEGSLGGEAA